MQQCLGVYSGYPRHWCVYSASVNLPVKLNRIVTVTVTVTVTGVRVTVSGV